MLSKQARKAWGSKEGVDLIGRLLSGEKVDPIQTQSQPPSAEEVVKGIYQRDRSSPVPAEKK